MRPVGHSERRSFKLYGGKVSSGGNVALRATLQWVKNATCIPDFVMIEFAVIPNQFRDVFTLKFEIIR